MTGGGRDLNPLRRLSKELADDKPDPLYDLVKSMIETQIKRTQRVLYEEDVGAMMTRRHIPQSYWLERSGYRLALMKCWRMSEIHAWIIIGRATAAKKFLMSEIGAIENAAKDTLKTNVETYLDEGDTVLHVKGVLN